MTDTHRTTREERLKAALRDNLKRRKLQARGRTESATDTAPEAPAGGKPPPPRDA